MAIWEKSQYKKDIFKKDESLGSVLPVVPVVSLSNEQGPTN